MAMAYFGRALISKFTVTSPMARPFASSSPSAPFVRSSSLLRYSSIICLRPLIALKEVNIRPAAIGIRCFSTRPTTSSLNDPSPNWSNRPPKETILLDGCDFEHWLVVMEPPEGNPTRDEIIDSYIKTLANVVGSEDEAKMKIYSVSTRHYFAFGALVSEELSYKIKTLPRVRWVLPDSYLDVKNKDYGGEPFIDGKAVPYDPKYHEEWVRNNARANERSRRNDRPRNFDRSRNFERRRENMQNRDFQNNAPPPMPNSEAQNSTSFRDGPGVSGGMPNRDAVPNSQYMNRDVPSPGTGMRGMPNRDFQSQGMPPNKDMSGMPNRGYQNQGMGGMPNRGYQNQGMGGMPSSGYQNPGGAQGIPNSGYQNQGVGSMPNSNYPNPGVGGMPNNGYQHQGNYQGSPGNYQGSPGNYQNPGMGGTPNRDYTPNSYAPNRDMGGTSNRDYSSNSYTPNRDMGGRDYQ